MQRWEKYIFWIVTSCIGLIFLWGGWVTNCIQGADKQQGMSQAAVETIKENTKEIKEDIKGIQDDLKAQKQTVEDRHREVLKLLLDIKKGTR
jgi:hypothetical protein